MNEKSGPKIISIFSLIIGIIIAVAGWLFGALQNASAQTYQIMDKRLTAVEKSVDELSIGDAVKKTILETIQSDIKEIKAMIKELK